MFADHDMTPGFKREVSQVYNLLYLSATINIGTLFLSCIFAASFFIIGYLYSCDSSTPENLFFWSSPNSWTGLC